MLSERKVKFFEGIKVMYRTHASCLRPQPLNDSAIALHIKTKIACIQTRSIQKIFWQWNLMKNVGYFRLLCKQNTTDCLFMYCSNYFNLLNNKNEGKTGYIISTLPGWYTSFTCLCVFIFHVRPCLHISNSVLARFRHRRCHYLGYFCVAVYKYSFKGNENASSIN